MKNQQIELNLKEMEAFGAGFSIPFFEDIKKKAKEAFEEIQKRYEELRPKF